MQKPPPVEAYPLCWPEGWPRTPEQHRDGGGRFRTGESWTGQGADRRYIGKKMITFDRARSLLRDELARLGTKGVVMSTNARLRADGEARADDADRRSLDPGIAVYFQFKGKPMVMAQDAFDSLAANTRSLGMAIEAMRQLERHGGGQMMERAFAGFTALPPPEGSKPKRPWWEVLRYSADPAERELLSGPEVEARYRSMAKKAHPDQGGTAEVFAELTQAKDDAVAELAGEQ